MRQRKAKLQAAEPDDGLVAVRLSAAHTHAGREYAAGAVIRVRQGIADWLSERGVGRRDRQGDPQPDS